MPDKEELEQQSDKKQPDAKSGGTLRDVAKAEQMIQLAIALPAGCLIGWLAGGLADKALHTSWIAIAGLILGAVGGFIQIYRMAARYLKNG